MEVIQTLTGRLEGRKFNGHILAALILDDRRLAAAAGLEGESLDVERVLVWLRRQPLPPGYRLTRTSLRQAEYRLTSARVPPREGSAGQPDPARVRAVGAAVVGALAAAFPEPVSGSDLRDAIRHGLLSPPSEHRRRMEALAKALRAAHPLGVAQPHPVLDVLGAAGLLSKLCDPAGRAVWVAPGVRRISAEILRRLTPYAPSHERLRKKRHDAGRAGGRTRVARAASRPHAQPGPGAGPAEAAWG